MKGWKMILVIYVFLVVFFYVQFGNAADYATYMRVVGYHDSFVVVVDEDGQKWEIEAATSKCLSPINKGDNVLVIMDLDYVPEEGKFVIGHTYIQGKL